MGDLPCCETILEKLSPCAKQQNNDVKPQQTCCDATQSLSRYSNDKEDRHEICDYIKAVAILAGLPINDFSCISFLPHACGLSVKHPPISLRLTSIVPRYFLISFLLFFFFIPHLASTSSATTCGESTCTSTSPQIRFPFWLKKLQPSTCGYEGFGLTCNPRHRWQSILITVPSSSRHFAVQEIDYLNQNVWITDPNNCFPRRFMDNDFSFDEHYMVTGVPSEWINSSKTWSSCSVISEALVPLSEPFEWDYLNGFELEWSLKNCDVRYEDMHRNYRTCGRVNRPIIELSAIPHPQPSAVIMGLDDPTIDSYPKTQLGESLELPKPNDNTCSICLGNYQPRETLRTIPECNHYFHANCIDEWLRRNATWPIC
ncbi:hypothetical protein L3X38_028563 [Prunus dulcis]|uniref:RING-type E3 ubiquitin transferase n=1 Tax=Prunus dulcis TaxID=3755 RepID=A0AAD4Z1B5_PRUDU|nr:hypothetical protein L3X38_028563 [Prunus dulcis]